MSQRADKLNQTRFRRYLRECGIEAITKDAFNELHAYILESIVKITKEATIWRDKRRKKTLEKSDIDNALRMLFPDHIQNALDALAPVLMAVNNRTEFIIKLSEILLQKELDKEFSNASIDMTVEDEEKELLEKFNVDTLEELNEKICGYCGLGKEICNCQYCTDCSEHERDCICHKENEEDDKIEKEEEKKEFIIKKKKKKRGWFWG